MVAAAILGAGALSAGASIFGSSKAADAQENAANAAIANQQSMYGQNKNILSPFIDAGSSVLGGLKNFLDPSDPSSPLAALLKLTTPGADMSTTLAQTPGYQFSLNQGNRAVTNALAARGLGNSPGAVAKGVANYTEGLAGNTWQNVVNSLQNVFTSGSGAMQNLVNTGANAGNALAGVGANTSNSISNALIGSGNAQAASSNAIGTAVGGLGNSFTSAALINQLTGGGNFGGLYGSNPQYGGSSILGGGAYGGSSSNPLAGLTAADYGEGF